MSGAVGDAGFVPSEALGSGGAGPRVLVGPVVVPVVGHGAAPRASGRSGRRDALVQATMRVTAAIGYEAATITDITDEAGCSRRAFNRYFRDKEAAFEVGYGEIARQMRSVVRVAYGTRDTPVGRTWACLGALAEFLAADPRRAELLVVHGHAAGQGVAKIRSETMRQLVDLILDNTQGLPRATGEPRLVAELVAGGIFEVVFTRTLRGQVRSLPDLVPDWVAVVMAPYVVMSAADPWVASSLS